ncbi:MAG TPA: D-glucuronyl C5-epimerase family protein [Longimicrobiales bacterium]|nr:D-glucuronyl C5-epimerase family protein [Longimicrobiales bacterium]
MTTLLRKHLRDVVNYVRGDAPFQLNEAAFSTPAYPVDLEFTLCDEAEYYSPRDQQGLPVRVYKTAGRQYNPTRIASFGLAHLNRFVASGSEEGRTAFLKVAEWFAAVEDGVWRYEFDWNDLDAPWSSCMAQGQGISVLTRAYHITGDSRYLGKARQALAPLCQSIRDGGLRSRIDGVWEFLEEYPSASPAHVLNGFLFAMIGIADLGRCDEAALAAVNHAELLASLEANIMRWDMGYWSAYDLAKGPLSGRNAATTSYHQLHVTQLQYLARIHHSAPLNAAATRWEGQMASAANRLRALGAKLMFRALVRTQR